MQFLKALLIVGVLFALPVSAAEKPEKSDNAALDSWANSVVSRLTRECEKTTHAQWVERYHDLSVEVMLRLKEMTRDQYRSRASSSSFREVTSVLFPQHVPSHGKAVSSGPCFAELWDFTKAKDSAQRNRALNQFETCNQAQYPSEVPDAAIEAIDCWKHLKK